MTMGEKDGTMPISDASTPVVAVVGLGNMGRGIAATLARTGRRVLGVDPQVTEVPVGVSPVSLSDAVREAETVVLSLPSSDVVEQVLEAGGLTSTRLAPHMIIDTSTADPIISRRLAADLRRHGHSYLDAPVSGGPRGAAEGALTMFLGGAEEDCRAAAAVLDALTGQVTHVGGPGAGATAKLVNNMLVAVHLQAGGEALRLIQAAELDPHRVLGAVNAASGRSAVTEINLPQWVLTGSFDSGFPVGLMSRDIHLAVEAAESWDIEMPLAARSAAAWARLSEADPRMDFNRMAAQPPRPVAPAAAAEQNEKEGRSSQL